MSAQGDMIYLRTHEKKITVAINGVMNKVYPSLMLGMGTSTQSRASKYIPEVNESKYARYLILVAQCTLPRSPKCEINFILELPHTLLS